MVDGPSPNQTTNVFSTEIINQVIATLSVDEVAAIMFITLRAPEKKPKTLQQGVCLSSLSHHRLIQNVYVELTEETGSLGRWTSFRLTPLGLTVRQKIAALRRKYCSGLQHEA